MCGIGQEPLGRVGDTIARHRWIDLEGEEVDPNDYDLGAELLDSDPNFVGLDFIGDVGRDPIGEAIAND